MLRANRLIVLVSVLVLAASVAGVTAHAQDGIDARTTYNLNLRAGPGTAYASLGVLPGDTPLVAEARTAALDWLLVRVADGAGRGWVASLYLNYEPGFVAASLPVSEEIIAESAPGEPAGEVVAGSSAEAALLAIPVLPPDTGRARAIFQGSDNDPHTLIKVGDCNSSYWEFLGPLGEGAYTLGSYAHLGPTIAFFGASLAQSSLTAHGGFTVLSVLESLWFEQDRCGADETVLDCELRTRRPAVAVMMFGPNDVFHLSAAQFETAVRQVVTRTIQAGTIPVLTTFTWCRTDDFHQKGLQFNLVTAQIAAEFNIPLINFWRAARALPYCGLMDDTHLSKPVMTTTADFTGEETRTGHTLRNLLTLQTLDAIRRAALQ